MAPQVTTVPPRAAADSESSSRSSKSPSTTGSLRVSTFRAVPHSGQGNARVNTRSPRSLPVSRTSTSDG
ncbi:hypothetical protein BRC93_11615 [Halobacteriales archaeon QS_5_70_15]|nr:MAG: hypothetical protein BRC93_11615 [Halobacteriales archaeon QS_5_70_15]